MKRLGHFWMFERVLDRTIPLELLTEQSDSRTSPYSARKACSDFMSLVDASAAVPGHTDAVPSHVVALNKFEPGYSVS